MEQQMTIQPAATAEQQFALTPVGQMTRQFEMLQRMGRMYEQSTIVPAAYQKNLGNCVIALDMATRMNCNPLMVMQNLYVVNGNPSFSSKFLIATINSSGRFSPLRYEFKGEEGTPEHGCRCVAYELSDKDHKEPLYGDWITIAMADKEGWSKKPGSKWLTMPEQMLRYRAAAFWQRVYAPEISMGLMTAEEQRDIVDVEYQEVKETAATAPAADNAGDIIAAVNACTDKAALDELWGSLSPAQQSATAIRSAVIGRNEKLRQAQQTAAAPETAEAGQKA